MSLIKLQQLSKSFGTQDVLKQINLQLEENRCYGLIGANGSGKTTLLNIISGEEEPSSGVCIFSPHIRIGYVKQHIQGRQDISVLDLLTSEYQPVVDQVRFWEERLSSAGQAEMEECLKKYQNALDAYEAIEGDSLINRCQTLLKALGLGDKIDQAVNVLSGGEKSTLGLAKALLMRPNLLILDEPGNHQDFMGLAWLESYLLKFKGTILVVSHNRYLLDNLCDEIFELTQSSITSFPGNYSAYRMAKLKKAVAGQAD